MSLNKTFESARLVFRPLGSNYVTKEYLNWLNDPEVTRYLEIFGPYSEDQLKDYLQSVDKNDRLMFWAIHIKENNKHIGNIKIDPVNRHHG